MSRILFVHNSFPGRFEFLLSPLMKAGHRLAAIAPAGRAPPGVIGVKASPTHSSTSDVFRYAAKAEDDLIRGHAAALAALRLRDRDFIPDLIIGHGGWGDTAFMREVFPAAKQLLVGEFYYRTRGSDIDFDPEFGLPDDDKNFRVHAKNAVICMAYADADRIIAPTEFQASTFPAALRRNIRVIHEGVNVEAAKPVDDPRLTLPDGRVLDRGTPVVTFVNRAFEPLRGFHIMMRAIPHLLRARPDAHVLMIGDDATKGYGRRPPPRETWRSVFSREVGEGLDPDRVHFVGALPYADLVQAFSLGRAHVHLTYPFVLSWSLIDAMASGALIVGSDTAPVREVVQDRVNGLLVDFFDPPGLAAVLAQACDHPERHAGLRAAARRTAVERFDQQRICRPAWFAAIEEMLAGG